MARLERVIVVGGGVGGLTTALALQRAGITVEVHERHDDFQHHATGFTLWSYAVGRLEKLGIGPEALDAVGGRVAFTEIRNQEGRLIERMPVGEVAAKLGAPTYEIRRAGLLRAIAAELAEGVLRLGSECVRVEEEGERVSAVLADGSRAAGDLLVGADGIHSIVRTTVAGKTPLRYSGYDGVSAVVPFTHSLLPPNTHVDIWGRGAKAGVADLGHGHARWYVTRRAPAGTPFPKDEVRAHLRGWYELAQAAVAATPEEDLKQAAFFDIPPIRTWCRGRMVLLGDAAHATTPFAAMGANMAIEDAAQLIGLLGAAESVESGLHAFQDARKKRTEDIVKKGRVMSRLTQLHSSFAAWLRDQALLHMPPDQVERVTKEMASGG
jgi:2-polyprenyl-6-methoxyphenol hydroxylase-like FAD-dependent oxidoreductase